ncbi:MAG: hypothetical protein LH472_06545, partial [Pyrinomonadaceae bacterium]|nr:hypothetical protein [Pyrinomonadaceae bacterium]
FRAEFDKIRGNFGKFKKLRGSFFLNLSEVLLLIRDEKTTFAEFFAIFLSAVSQRAEVGSGKRKNEFRDGGTAPPVF